MYKLTDIIIYVECCISVSFATFFVYNKKVGKIKWNSGKI